MVMWNLGGFHMTDEDFDMSDEDIDAALKILGRRAEHYRHLKNAGLPLTPVEERSLERWDSYSARVNERVQKELHVRDRFSAKYESRRE
jgi:hypothetical protein